MTDTWTGKCPSCGEALQIPGHLKQFSCMYCGARLTPEQLVTEAAAKTSPAPGGADSAAYYSAHVLKAVVNYAGLEREVTQAAFIPAFERYSRENKETFRQLDQAVAAGALTPEDAAKDLLDQLEAHWDARKRTSAVMDRDKFLIAIFLVPAVRRLALPVSEAYCQTLRDQWCARHPKSPFNLGDYDTIASGFRKKYLGLCFITTAVCQADGKPDDCPELTAFRGFRDGYLRACPDGPALIDEYYEIAPAIVLRIDLSADPAARYARIRRDYLEPCYADIRAGRLEQCKNRYVTMVRALEREYLAH